MPANALHNACAAKDWKEATRLASARPGGGAGGDAPTLCREPDAQGNEPLHLALVYGAPAAVVRALLAARPEAARVTNHAGHLPLHLSVRNAAPREVVALVLAANRSAVRVADGGERRCLHLAAAHGASVDVVQLLLEARPAAIGEADGQGLVPLLIAVRAEQPPPAGCAVSPTLSPSCPITVLHFAGWRNSC